MMKGYYKLKANVRNPRPDRRSKRRLDCAEVWQAGTEVWIQDTREEEFKKAEEIAGERLDGKPTDRGFIRFKDGTQIHFNLSMKAVSQAHDYPEWIQGNGIVNAVEPAEKTLGHVLKESYWAPDDLLALLIETGKVTLQDVVALKDHDLAPTLTTDSPEWDEVNDTFRKKHGL